LAEAIEHLVRVGERDLVLVLGSRRAHADPLDGNDALVARRPDADRAFLDRAEVTLPMGLPCAQPSPAVARHQELALDLLRHERVQPWTFATQPFSVRE